MNKALTGWESFDPHESGFKQMYELYTYLEEKIDHEIVVVDAADLLMDPEGTMKGKKSPWFLLLCTLPFFSLSFDRVFLALSQNWS